MRGLERSSQPQVMRENSHVFQLEERWSFSSRGETDTLQDRDDTRVPGWRGSILGLEFSQSEESFCSWREASEFAIDERATLDSQEVGRFLMSRNHISSIPQAYGFRKSQRSGVNPLDLRLGMLHVLL